MAPRTCSFTSSLNSALMLETPELCKRPCARLTRALTPAFLARAMAKVGPSRISSQKSPSKILPTSVRRLRVSSKC
eukprot:3947186-Alexandrium_andersonii.AAC.1